MGAMVPQPLVPGVVHPNGMVIHPGGMMVMPSAPHGMSPTGYMPNTYQHGPPSLSAPPCMVPGGQPQGGAVMAIMPQQVASFLSCATSDEIKAITQFAENPCFGIDLEGLLSTVGLLQSLLQEAVADRPVAPPTAALLQPPAQPTLQRGNPQTERGTTPIPLVQQPQQVSAQCGLPPSAPQWGHTLTAPPLTAQQQQQQQQSSAPPAPPMSSLMDVAPSSVPLSVSSAGLRPPAPPQALERAVLAPNDAPSDQKVWAFNPGYPPPAAAGPAAAGPL